MVGPGGPLLALTIHGHSLKTLLSTCRWQVSARKVAWALSGCITTKSADYCMIINEWAWLRSRVCLLRLEVDLGSVLESELGHKMAIWCIML